MSRTFKHQDTYDYIHENKSIPRKRLLKLLKYFDRCNWWDWDLKIMYRKYKDVKKGGVARIKGKNYKNH